MIEFVTGIFAMLIAIAFSVAFLWTLIDILFHAPDLTFRERAIWVLAVLLFNVLAVIVYVRLGPGKARWDPWALMRR